MSNGLRVEFGNVFIDFTGVFFIGEDWGVHGFDGHDDWAAKTFKLQQKC